MKSKVFFLFLISVTACIFACSSTRDPKPENSLEPGWHEGSLLHDGLERVFLFYVPENPSAAKGLPTAGLPENPPVVILLHGGTAGMEKLFDNNYGGTNEWPIIADEEGFLLLVPNGTNIETGSPVGNDQNWNDCREFGPNADDVGFIGELITWAEHIKTGININRVYVTGASNGGMMAYRLARELDDRIAAIAAFIANKPENNQCNGPDNPIPAMIVNGTADPLMPYDGGEVASGGRGVVLSTQATVAFWAGQIGVSAIPSAMDSLPNLNTEDESRVIRFRYGSKNPDAPLVLYKVSGGGHFMPTIDHPFPNWVEQLLGNQNEDVEGARIAWEFLSQHSKK